MSGVAITYDKKVFGNFLRQCASLGTRPAKPTSSNGRFVQEILPPRNSRRLKTPSLRLAVQGKFPAAGPDGPSLVGRWTKSRGSFTVKAVLVEVSADWACYKGTIRLPGWAGWTKVEAIGLVLYQPSV